MSWTLTTSGAAVFKAGINANSNIQISGAALTKWSDEAEGRIVASTRRDWVTEYSGLSTEVKSMLSDVCSSLIAINIISFDMSGYTSKREAETMLDVQYDIASKGLKILEDFKSNTIKGV